MCDYSVTYANVSFLSRPQKATSLVPTFVVGITSGLPAIALAQARRAGCRATKSHCSRSESAKLSGGTGLPAVIFIRCHSSGFIRISCGGLAGLPAGLHAFFSEMFFLSSNALVLIIVAVIVLIVISIVISIS